MKNQSNEHTNTFTRRLSIANPVTFLHSYGGLGFDGGSFIQSTQDGGFIVAGNSTDLITGKESAIVAKWDFKGELDWVRKIGDSDNYDYGYAAIETANLNILFVGHSCSYYSFSCEGFISKFNPDGSLALLKTTKKSSVYNRRPDDSWISIQEKNDANLILLGERINSQSIHTMLLTELTADAATSWSKTFSASTNIYPRSLRLSQTGDIFIAGYAELGLGENDAFLMMTDKSGNTLWARAMGGSNHDYAYSSWLTTDESIVVVGETYSNGAGDADGFVTKFCDTGSRLWAFSFGGDSRDFFSDVRETTGGDLICLGTTCSFGPGSCSPMIAKLNGSTGDQLWVKSLGTTYNDYAYSLDLEEDDSMLLTGYSTTVLSGQENHPLIVARLDKNGIIWNCTKVMDISPTVTDLSSTIYFGTSFSVIDEELDISTRDESSLDAAFEWKEEICLTPQLVTTEKAKLTSRITKGKTSLSLFSASTNRIEPDSTTTASTATTTNKRDTAVASTIEVTAFEQAVLPTISSSIFLEHTEETLQTTPAQEEADTSPTNLLDSTDTLLINSLAGGGAAVASGLIVALIVALVKKCHKNAQRARREGGRRVGRYQNPPGRNVEMNQIVYRH